jgi:hypothetical protein
VCSCNSSGPESGFSPSRQPNSLGAGVMMRFEVDALFDMRMFADWMVLFSAVQCSALAITSFTTSLMLSSLSVIGRRFTAAARRVASRNFYSSMFPAASATSNITNSAAAAAAHSSPVASVGSATGSVRAAARLGRAGYPARTGGGSVPSLQHFLLRSQVLALYRRVCRLSRRCSSSQQKNDTRSHARVQIEAMRNASDSSHIKLLLQDGKRQADSLETLLNMAH